MVESLKELNKICQKPRYKEVGNWMVRNILRDAALPITWLLLHTRITAHQVTFAALLVGIFAVFLCAFHLPGYFFAGILLLQFWYLLDHVDGQVARYRKTSSLTGRFFDFLMHHMIHGLFFFSMGWALYAKTQNEVFILLGFVTSFATLLFNMLHDIKYKTYFERLLSETSVASRVSPQRETSAVRAGAIFPKRIFKFLHATAQMHVVMNIYTLAAFLLVVLSGALDLRGILFFYYVLVMPLLFILKSFYWIKKGEIDSEFNATFVTSPVKEGNR